MNWLQSTLQRAIKEQVSYILVRPNAAPNIVGARTSPSLWTECNTLTEEDWLNGARLLLPQFDNQPIKATLELQPGLRLQVFASAFDSKVLGIFFANAAAEFDKQWAIISIALAQQPQPTPPPPAPIIISNPDKIVVNDAATAVRPTLTPSVVPVPTLDAVPSDFFVANKPQIKISTPPPPAPLKPAVVLEPAAPEIFPEIKTETRVNMTSDLTSMLTAMLELKASDLHLTSGEIAALRIDGEIQKVGQEPLTEKHLNQLIDPITPERNLLQFREENDTDFAYELAGTGRFRVNLFRDHHGRAAVFRHIPSKVPSFDQLGLPEVLKKLCTLNKGLVLVTGPTGSGKSTTLAAMVDFINQTRADHILTLEDPIEFVHSQKKCLIRQREVYRHTQSFARALKAALREDPNVILVGEMRDLETTALAIEIAETGHLVFGTLHTTTAISTIDRVIDQFPADRQSQVRTMLAESLKGVVAQTLVKKIGGGRAAAQEMLFVNTAVSAMIREGKNHMIASHMQAQKADGNVLLNEALATLVSKKLVSAKDALAKALDKNNLAEKLRALGVEVS